MGWGSNWGFKDASQARASAADFFLNTGNIGTPFGGTWCRGSSDCASGYACSGGRCVPIAQEKGSDGTLSGCGAPGGGGGCDSYVTQGMTASDAAARGYTWSNGVGTKGFNWVPIYSEDGCTITGCAMGPCGGEGGGGRGPVDCPGPRSCRYDAFGTVNCFCGDPPVGNCSEFCTAYKKSHGEDADGCSGLACDECSYCEEIFVSATGECKPIESGVPCHCDPDSLPECNKCNEDGTTEFDDKNCFKCVQILNEPCNCNPNIQLSKTCCYSLSEWQQGLSPVARCKQEIQNECENVCDDNPPYVDPCQGNCTTRSCCVGGGPCEEPPCPIPAGFSCPPCPPGHSCKSLGYVSVRLPSAGIETCYIEEICDKTNLPESCGECECNCHDDCPGCQICGDDCTCQPDPSCPTCEGQLCPGAQVESPTDGGFPVANDCCPKGQSCYAPQPAVNPNTYACCAEGNNIVPIYRSVFQTSACGATQTYTTFGPPKVSLSSECVACDGSIYDCSLPCARPTMLISNLWDGTTVSASSQIFNDNVAASISDEETMDTCCSVDPSWCPIDFPVEIDSYVYEYVCTTIPFL